MPNNAGLVQCALTNDPSRALLRDVAAPAAKPIFRQRIGIRFLSIVKHRRRIIAVAEKIVRRTGHRGPTQHNFRVAMTELIQEYLSDPAAGWERVQKLRLTGDLDPVTRNDVQRVCDELVGRVRENLVVIIDRLIGFGFQFAAEDTPLADPPEDVEEKIEVLQRLLSTAIYHGQPCPPLCPLLESWIRRIGSVDLSGYSDQWGNPVPKKPQQELGGGKFLADPFQFFSIDEMCDDLADRVADGDTCTVAFSSDALHKMGMSGGSRYQINVWSYDTDPFLFELPKEQRLVPYLRNTILKWGGFPGFVSYKNPPKKFLKVLTDGLRPF